MWWKGTGTGMGRVEIQEEGDGIQGYGRDCLGE